MNTFDAILTRRSTRQFIDQPIAPETLHQILEAAMSGPCCVNARDWSFLVVTERETLLNMAEADGIPGHLFRFRQRSFSLLVVDNGQQGEPASTVKTAQPFPGCR